MSLKSGCVYFGAKCEINSMDLLPHCSSPNIHLIYSTWTMHQNSCSLEGKKQGRDEPFEILIMKFLCPMKKKKLIDWFTDVIWKTIESSIRVTNMGRLRMGKFYADLNPCH